MGKRLAAAIGVMAAMAMLAAPSAMAATEVGSNCLASTTAGNNTIVPVTPAAGSTLPVTVPSSGVITRWRLSVAPFPGSIPEALKVLRPTGAANEFEAVAESVQSISAGSNIFDVRIPVRAGDHLGLYGSGSEIGTLACAPVAGGVIRLSKTPAPLGSKQVFGEEFKEVQVPVLALVEADADGDGYGDESQDKCPRSATLQTECPVALVDSVPLVKKGAVVLLVATTTTTPVTVSGTVKLPGGKGRARISAQVKLPAATKTAEAAKITRIRLNFPGKLKSTLAALAPGKALTLKLKASVTDSTGATASDSSNVKLKRQG
jgi:hypothetical protein